MRQPQRSASRRIPPAADAAPTRGDAADPGATPLRLHLNANLRHLDNVTWTPDLRHSIIEVAADAVDGIRERFKMRLAEPELVRHFDALLEHVFRELPAARIAALAA